MRISKKEWIVFWLIIVLALAPALCGSMRMPSKLGKSGTSYKKPTPFKELGKIGRKYQPCGCSN